MTTRPVKHSWYGLSVVLVLCLGSLSYGYLFSIISTTLGQPGFYDYFDLSASVDGPNYSYTNRIIGAANGLFSAGAFMGCWMMALVGDAIGRKKSFFVGSLISLVGSALQAGAAHIGMFLVARWVTGVGAGSLVTLVPIMQAEIAPPSTRGFLVGQHGFVLVLGYVFAGWIGYGCYFSGDLVFQWRFPLAVGCLWPLLALLILPWVPESPRWLLMRDRQEEAWQIITKMNNSADDPGERFAKEEFYQMTQQVEADRILRETENIWTLFTKPSYRKRMLCGFMTFFSNESTGILVIYNYSVVIYKGLGFHGSLPLLLSGVYVTIGALSNYVNAELADRLGRKALFIVGLSGCLLSLITETALDSKYLGTEDKPGLRVALFFLFLHLAFYGCCIDANSFIYCSEIFPTHIRTRGMGWSAGWLFLITIPYLEAAPTAFEKIAWKYYIVFIVLTAINIPIIYFFFPETKGLSLEEVGEKFGDEVLMHITHITDEERARLGAIIGLEKDQHAIRSSAKNKTDEVSLDELESDQARKGRE